MGSSNEGDNTESAFMRCPKFVPTCKCGLCKANRFFELVCGWSMSKGFLS